MTDNQTPDKYRPGPGPDALGPATPDDIATAIEGLEHDINSGDFDQDLCDQLRRVIGLLNRARLRAEDAEHGQAVTWDDMQLAANAVDFAANINSAFGGTAAEPLTRVAQMLGGELEHPIETTVVDALIKTGCYEEVDGDGDPESIIADHIRRLPEIVRGEFVPVDSGSDVETLYVHRPEVNQ